MNNEEKYNEALERASKLRVQNPFDTVGQMVEYIFPELAESEDERIRQYLINAVEEQVDIHQDWKEKCLNWLKEREPEENGWLFEEGKWYVKLCHNYDGDLRHFQKGNVYQAISETCITDGYHHISLGSWEIPNYFRPANKDEIPQKIEQSEDERIRNGLITLLKFGLEDNSAIAPGFNVTKEQALAWLEKQGEELVEPKWCHHKVDLSNCFEEYRKAYYDGWNNCNMQYSQCESEKSDVLKCLINGMKFYYDGNEEATWGTEKFSMKVKDILSWLEKQSEKSIIIDIDKMVFKYSTTEDGDLGFPINCMIRAYRKGIEDVLELQKGFAPTEQKIHIGEGLIKQVKEVHEYPPTTKEDIRKALMSIYTEEYEEIWKRTFGESYKEFVDKLLNNYKEL